MDQKRWEVCWAAKSSTHLQVYLDQGWEPFSVTTDGSQSFVWLRRERLTKSEQKAKKRLWLGGPP